MAGIIFNHDTSDISAASGSVTIDGVAPGGGGGDTINVETLAADKTLTNADDVVQALDPNAVTRNIDLPAEEANLRFIIYNTGTSQTDQLVLRDDASAALGIQIGPFQRAELISDGASWFVLGAISGQGDSPAGLASSLGYLAKVVDNGGTSLGANSIVDSSGGVNGTAVGYDARCLGNRGTAIGSTTRVQSGATDGVAIGHDADVFATEGVAIGRVANVGGSAQAGIAIGADTDATAAQALAIGDTAQASGASSIAIGTATDATQVGSIAIGDVAQATGTSGSIAIGDDAVASGTSAVAIGDAADAWASGSVAIGSGAQATGSNNNIGIGTGANATGLQAISIGNLSDATFTSAVAIGDVAQATATEAVAIGDAAVASATAAVALGKGTDATQTGNIAIGDAAQATGTNGAIAIGDDAVASGTSSIAIGNATDATVARGIALGDSSQATRAAELTMNTGSGVDVYSRGNIGLSLDTTTTTPSEMFCGLESDGLRLTIKAESVFAFDALITGRDNTTGNCCVYRFTGAIKRDNANNTTLVGTPTKEVVGEDDAGFDCSVSADDTNEALVFTVTAVAANATQWSGSVDFAETQF